jgi:DNA repair protein RadA/Sms
MSKAKVKFVCKNCGFESPTWLGKCPSCGEWNSFEEEKVIKKSFRRTVEADNQIYSLNGEVKSESKRILTGINEFDRTLGGGLMPGSLILIGGDPGIGKSTLVMQAAAKSNIETLYVTGEESVNQINLRANRLGIKAENVSLLAETNYEIIESTALKLKPKILIVDSIQTVFDPRLDNAP